jgi:hypothetical protein
VHHPYLVCAEQLRAGRGVQPSTPPEASSVPPFSSLQASAVFSAPASQVLEQAAFPQEAQAAAVADARLPEACVAAAAARLPEESAA